MTGMEVKSCACGCGALIKAKNKRGIERFYDIGHSPRIRRDVKDYPCACGCGTFIPARRNDGKINRASYIKGHNLVGRIVPEETRLALSKAGFKRSVNNFPDGQRACITCLRVFPRDEFLTSSGPRRGHKSTRRLCNDCSREYQRLHAQKRADANPNALYIPFAMRKYNLSRAEVLDLLEIKVCEICEERPAQEIDHDHDTGQVRGRLCQYCNHGLGNFKDNIDILSNAIGYLLRDTNVLERIEESNVIR